MRGERHFAWLPLACLSLALPAMADNALTVPPDYVMQRAPEPEPEPQLLAASEDLPAEAPPRSTAANAKVVAHAKAAPLPLLGEAGISDEEESFEPMRDASFSRALSNVYERHPQIKAQREALQATDETVNQAFAGFKPTANAEYSKGRHRENLDSAGWRYGADQQKVLDVVQPVFRGGGTIASISSANSRISAGQAQLMAVEQQVLLSAIAAYTDVIAKRSVLDVSRNNAGVLGKQLDATRARFNVGELTRTDTAQSEARLAVSQANLEQAMGDLASSSATFRRVIGYEAPAGLKMPPLPAHLPATLEEAIQWAEANEPTLEAAKHLERATRSDIRVQEAAILPRVDLEGRMERSSGQTSSIFGPRRIADDSLMLNVNIPIYQAGVEWSHVRQAKDLAQQAKFTTFDTHDAAVETVMRAWEDYHAARAVILSDRQAVKSAQVALIGIRQENLYGTRTILDVLNTQQDLFAAQVSLINAEAAERQQAYRLLASVGRLTARDLGLPVAYHEPKRHYQEVKYQMIGF